MKTLYEKLYFYRWNLFVLFALGVMMFAGFDPFAGSAGAALAMAAAGAKEPETLRKITLGTIGVQPDIEALMKADGKKLDLADIYGVATKAKPGQSDYGPFVAFLGDFRAVRLSDKATFQARKIIFPQFIEEELYGAFPDGVNGNVEFAMRISAKFDKDAATKYVYEMKPIIKPAESAQLSALEAKMKDAVKALPAPSVK